MVFIKELLPILARVLKYDPKTGRFSTKLDQFTETGSWKLKILINLQLTIGSNLQFAKVHQKSVKNMGVDTLE
jgi:hypothetical protein